MFSRVFESHNRRAGVAAAVAAVLLMSGSLAQGQSADYGGYRPHYQGYGVTTRGGRGGAVYKVTHLNDTTNATDPNWEGSFRKAVTASGPRFVIFEVSGTIRLVGRITITSPYLTIAGQSAPSPGITIRDADFRIDTHDIVMQHIRIRVGDRPTQVNPNGIWVRTGGNNIVIDHVSVSWSVHNSIIVFAAPGNTEKGNGDITIIDSIVAEALACGVHTTIPCATRGPHSRAMLVGDDNTDTTYNNGIPRIAYVRNLSAHNYDRHPAIQGDVHAFVVNNVIYNPSGPLSGVYFTSGFDSGPALGVVKGNLLIPGPTTPGHNGFVPKLWKEEGPVHLIHVGGSVDPKTKVYLEGNYYAAHCGGTACLSNPTAQWMLAKDREAIYKGINVRVTTPPISLTNLPLSSALSYTEVENYVLANAGARPLDRDSVDARIVQDVRKRTGRPIDSPNEVGGFPILAQNRRALTVPTSPHAVVDGVGRTRVEAWLEAFARELEPAQATSPSTPSAPLNPRIVY